MDIGSISVMKNNRNKQKAAPVQQRWRHHQRFGIKTPRYEVTSGESVMASKSYMQSLHYSENSDGVREGCNVNDGIVISQKKLSISNLNLMARHNAIYRKVTNAALLASVRSNARVAKYQLVPLFLR